MSIPPRPHIGRPGLHRPRPGFHFIDPNFSGRFRRDIAQAGLATLALGIILAVERGVSNGIVVVTIAASTFTVFVIPHSVASEGRRIVGGHVVGVLVGLGVVLMLEALVGPGLWDAGYLRDIAAAAAVGLSVVGMTATNTEHPAAAGTAFGLVTLGPSWDFVLFILSAAVILSMVRLMLRGWLRNLL